MCVVVGYRGMRLSSSSQVIQWDASQPEAVSDTKVACSCCSESAGTP